MLWQPALFGVLGSAAAAPLAPGTLLSVGAQPLNSGLVYFMGSAPSGSSLLGRDQVGGNANTSLVGGNLTRVNTNHGSWLCLDLTATTGYMGFPNTALLRSITTRFSIAAHVQVDALANKQTVFNAPYSNSLVAPFNSICFRRASSAITGRCFIVDSGTRVQIDSTLTMFSTGLHWFGMTWDGSLGTPEIRFYLDGAQLGSTVTASVPNGPVDWGSVFPNVYVGNFGPLDTSEGNDGAFYTCAIWNRVLALADFQALVATPRMMQAA